MWTSEDKKVHFCKFGAQTKKICMKITSKVLAIALVGTILIGGCKKKGCTDPLATNYSAEAKKDDESCSYVPVIVLNGDASVTANLNSTYTDEGATATNNDGSSVTVTADITAVNTSSTGTYTVTYTATNETGTATATRAVTVVIGQSVWTSNTWEITSDCGATAFPLASPPTISAGGSSALIFDSFFTAVGGTANATINGSTITFSNQTINITVGDVIFSGTGTMNASGTEFTVNYSYENTTPFIGEIGTCTAVYTKQ